MAKRTKGPEDGNRTKHNDVKSKFPNNVIPLAERIEQKSKESDSIDALRLEKALNSALQKGEFPAFEHTDAELAEIVYHLAEENDSLKNRTRGILQQIRQTEEGRALCKEGEEYSMQEEFHIFVRSVLDDYLIPPVNIPSATVDEEMVGVTFRSYAEKLRYSYSIQKDPKKIIQDTDKMIIAALFLIERLCGSREFESRVFTDVETTPNGRNFSYSSVDPVRLYSFVKKLELMKTALLDIL